jgi:hypothetical protein
MIFGRARKTSKNEVHIPEMMVSMEKRMINLMFGQTETYPE